MRCITSYTSKCNSSFRGRACSSECTVSVSLHIRKMVLKLQIFTYMFVYLDLFSVASFFVSYIPFVYCSKQIIYCSVCYVTIRQGEKTLFDSYVCTLGITVCTISIGICLLKHYFVILSMYLPYFVQCIL